MKLVKDPAGATPSGLLDMAGNVWEWCSDFYDAQTYRSRPLLETPNPTGPATGTFHVLRGGAYYSDGNSVRCACRARLSPGFWIGSYGFRVARSFLP